MKQKLKLFLSVFVVTFMISMPWMQLINVCIVGDSSSESETDTVTTVQDLEIEGRFSLSIKKKDTNSKNNIDNIREDELAENVINTVAAKLRQILQTDEVTFLGNILDWISRGSLIAKSIQWLGESILGIYCG